MTATPIDQEIEAEAKARFKEPDAGLIAHLLARADASDERTSAHLMRCAAERLEQLLLSAPDKMRTDQEDELLAARLERHTCGECPLLPRIPPCPAGPLLRGGGGVVTVSYRSQILVTDGIPGKPPRWSDQGCSGSLDTATQHAEGLARCGHTARIVERQVVGGKVIKAVVANFDARVAS